jgi:hypothetical protein
MTTVSLIRFTSHILRRLRCCRIRFSRGEQFLWHRRLLHDRVLTSASHLCGHYAFVLLPCGGRNSFNRSLAPKRVTVGQPYRAYCVTVTTRSRIYPSPALPPVLLVEAFGTPHKKGAIMLWSLGFKGCYDIIYCRLKTYSPFMFSASPSLTMKSPLRSMSCCICCSFMVLWFRK